MDYFNPRSREGSDTTTSTYSSRPTDFNPRSREGSDPALAAQGEKIRISIHAPARGATVLAPVAPAQKQKFQSTLPRGERLNRLVLVDTFVDISIHAPARGATQFRELPQIDVQFQSTLPRGERPCVYSSTLSARHFNPRSREGSDR